MAISQSSKTLTKNAWKVSNLLVQKKPRAVGVSKLRLRKSKRDFADEVPVWNLRNLVKDARKLAAELVQKNWLCISWVWQSKIQTAPEVEIARENHCHLKPSGNAFGGKA